MVVPQADPFAFTFSYNPFFKDYMPNFELIAVASDANKHEVFTRTAKTDWLWFETLDRDPFKKFNVDEALVVNLEKVPASINDILFFVKAKNLVELGELQGRTKMYETTF